MYFHIGQNSNVLFVIVILFILSCITNKRDVYYHAIQPKEQGFDERLHNYKSEVTNLIHHQLGKKFKSSDQLVFFCYTGFGDATVKCDDLKKMTTDQILYATHFGINSSYTFVLDKNGNYKTAVWINGANENPSAMNTYAKEKKIIEAYVTNQYEIMFQYSNCDYDNFLFGYKPNAELAIYKVNIDSIKLVVQDSIE
ncbi:MAG TPA: hypothetical protein PKC30_17105 [Saprospiraceae bacterium]|nr:hypothetical protein [Saprospiraceae bacterium]